MIRTRRTLAFPAYFLIIWGTFWIFGFLISQFVQQKMLIWIWIPTIVVGSLSSTFVGIYLRRSGRVVRTIHGLRIGWFFATLFCFVIVWFAIIQTLSALQIALFLVTVVMFGYIVMGIWLRSTVLMGICIIVTILAMLGYYTLPTYFWIWEALFGGGVLAGGGLYILFLEGKSGRTQ